jgi:hypothetical protein
MTTAFFTIPSNSYHFSRINEYISSNEGRETAPFLHEIQADRPVRTETGGVGAVPKACDDNDDTLSTSPKTVDIIRS